MKAAIYARYSTDMQNETSITGQVANCKTIALANGWSVYKEYYDEAISGSDDNRPRYVQLLADSENGKFDVIIVDETSRLTRRPGELPRLMEILAFRNQLLVDCKGFDSRNETAALLASVYGGIDSLELRKIKDRTHRGLRERAKAGYSAGGKTYGYATEAIDPDDPESKKRLFIIESQAEIVREIFTRYADGESPRSICNDLNARDIPSPGATWNRTKRRSRGWMGSSLSGTAKSFTGILRRELYIGQVIWNRRQFKKVPGTSRRVPEIRPQEDWIIRDHPELRILSDNLWNQVQARLKAARKSTHKANKRPRGRPSRYLLSGLMKCGVCDANYIMQNARSYACSSRTNGGKHLCSNGVTVRREVAETAILENIKTRLLSDEVVEYVSGQFKAALHDLEAKRPESERLIADLRSIDAKLSKLTDAIEAVGISGTLADRLTALEQEKAEIENKITVATSTKCAEIEILPDVLPALIKRWRELVSEIEELSKNPATTPADFEAAREHLHALLGPVTLKPRNGVLWAHPSPNAKSPVETRPLGGLSINSPELVAGA